MARSRSGSTQRPRLDRGPGGFARAALIAAAILLPVLGPGRAGAQEPRPRAIAVTGEGSIRARPEIARLRLGVFTEAPTAAQASNENARRMQAVVEALRGAGIPESAIQTVQLTIEPVYDYPQDPPGSPRLRGFQARNVVEARFEDLTRLGEVLDAAIAVGGNTVEGVFFELRDPGEARARALAEAVTDARRKAETLAQAAGVGLGEIREIQATYGPPVPFQMARMATMDARAEAAPPPPVSPGEMTVTADVQVVYAIE